MAIKLYRRHGMVDEQQSAIQFCGSVSLTRTSLSYHAIEYGWMRRSLDTYPPLSNSRCQSRTHQFHYHVVRHHTLGFMPGKRCCSEYRTIDAWPGTLPVTIFTANLMLESPSSFGYTFRPDDLIGLIEIRVRLVSL